MDVDVGERNIIILLLALVLLVVCRDALMEIRHSRIIMHGFFTLGPFLLDEETCGKEERDGDDDDHVANDESWGVGE